jgi:hypothetical protein
LLIVGVSVDPTILDMRRAPFELPLLTLLCAGYFAESRDQPYRFAACLSVAALIQSWMLALLLFLLARRRPLAFFFGLALFGGLLTLLMAGAGYRTPAAFAAGLRSFWTGGAGGNQSIFGVTRALLAPDPDAPLLMIAADAVAFMLVLCGFWLATARVTTAGSEGARRLLGLATVSILLVKPVSRRSDFILLVPALWTLLIGEQKGISRLVRGTAIVIFAVLTSGVVNMTAVPVFFISGAALWTVLLLAAAQDNRQLVEAV